MKKHWTSLWLPKIASQDGGCTSGAVTDCLQKGQLHRCSLYASGCSHRKQLRCGLSNAAEAYPEQFDHGRPRCSRFCVHTSEVEINHTSRIFFKQIYSTVDAKITLLNWSLTGPLLMKPCLFAILWAFSSPPSFVCTWKWFVYTSSASQNEARNMILSQATSLLSIIIPEKCPFTWTFNALWEIFGQYVFR